MTDLTIHTRSDLDSSLDCVGSVRSLTLSQSRWFTPEVATQYKNLSFPSLQSLTLDGLQLDLFDMQLDLFDREFLFQFFSHFSPILTSLTITGSTIQPARLFLLVSMFQKLVNLRLERVIVEETPETLPSPTIYPRSQGKWPLSNLGSRASLNVAPLVDSQLPMTSLACLSDVVVMNCHFRTSKSQEDLFVACPKTVKTIKLYHTYYGRSHLCGSSTDAHVSSNNCLPDAS